MPQKSHDATIYRDSFGFEEEIEIVVEGYFEDGGFVVYGASRADNGERVELTQTEIDKISRAAELEYVESAEEYAAEGYDRAGDR